MCGGAQRLYGGLRLTVAALRNLPHACLSGSFVKLLSRRASKKGRRINWQGLQVKEGRVLRGSSHQSCVYRRGKLERRSKAANVAYGFGKGVEERLTSEQAVALEAFANQELA